MWKTVKVFIPQTDDSTEKIRELLALRNPNMFVIFKLERLEMLSS